MQRQRKRWQKKRHPDPKWIVATHGERNYPSVLLFSAMTNPTYCPRTAMIYTTLTLLALLLQAFGLV